MGLLADAMCVSNQPGFNSVRRPPSSMPTAHSCASVRVYSDLPRCRRITPRRYHPARLIHDVTPALAVARVGEHRRLSPDRPGRLRSVHDIGSRMRVVRDDTGVPVANAAVRIEAFFADSTQARTTVAVGHTNLVARTNATGAYRDQPLSFDARSPPASLSPSHCRRMGPWYSC
jgi:hypothetical protein